MHLYIEGKIEGEKKEKKKKEEYKAARRRAKGEKGEILCCPLYIAFYKHNCIDIVHL